MSRLTFGRKFLAVSVLLGLGMVAAAHLGAADGKRAMGFQAQTVSEAKGWQQSVRARLVQLMMGGAEPERVPLAPTVLRREAAGTPGAGWTLEEVTIQTLADRRVKGWVGRPVSPAGKVGVVLALHGHGGSGEQVVRGEGLYWYGRALLEMGYLVVAPDIGQHELQHTNWSLMGERTWDALRFLDYGLTLPEADADRVAVAGLSLGGETTMYVAALDERVKLACSSGWLTTVANMKNGHCPCFNFPGLEEHFDFADIFACAAPRGLVCELGEQERAPGGFPVSIGRQAFAAIQGAYRVLGAESNARLTVHNGPHVFDGREFLALVRERFGSEARPLPDDAAARAWLRFSDGAESFEGTPYHWLGRSDVRMVFEAAPAAGDALELGWGAKGDQREAVLEINGVSLPVKAGGHWGFRWLRVPLPAGVKGERYDIRLTKGAGMPAFLSEVRLVGAKASASPPELKSPRFKAALLPAQTGEAFLDKRAEWERELSPPAGLGAPERVLFGQAERHARQANEAFYRCRRFVEGWMARADPGTGLIPRNLNESRDFWNGRDSAADNYPFMVLTAAMTDRPLFEGRMLEMLRTETRLTSRVDRLPDDYSFSKKGWRREALDLDQVIFDGAEYVKDGLLPITEWLGPSPWSERMVGIIDDIWKHAAMDTPYGRIPTRNFEVCGDLLQACARLYWFTGQTNYLDWAVRLGDYFLLGTNHPTRDLKQLRLIDHGCEVINGLSELYVAVAHARPEKKRQYQPPLHELFDCILEKARNEHGLLYTWFNPASGEHSDSLCDTWGYDYDGFYTLWLVDGEGAYRDAVRKALGNLRGNYVGACWADKSADGFADSIEGAINLLNREAVAAAAEWVDSQTRLMWIIQKADGIIEGWHGDGNIARTSLMYALWKTQGVTVEPWREDVWFGAVRDGAGLFLVVSAQQGWQGKLVFDRPRHREVMHLPLDYPRINQFPEWYTVEKAGNYSWSVGGKAERKSGAELASGVPLALAAGEVRVIRVKAGE